MNMISVILSIFGLFLIPLSIRYFLNPSPVRPVLGIPAESIFLASAFLLLKPPVASSLTFSTHSTLSSPEKRLPKLVRRTESLPHALQIASIVAFFVAGDVLFKALLYIGVDPQSDGEIAPTLLNVLIIHGRTFGGILMDLARSVVGVQHVLLNCAGRLGRTLSGLGDEVENDIDLESRHIPIPHHHIMTCPEFQMKY